MDSTGDLVVFGNQGGGSSAKIVYWKYSGGVWQNPVAFNLGTYFSGYYYESPFGGAIDASGNFHFATGYGSTTTGMLYWSSLSGSPVAGTMPAGDSDSWTPGDSVALDSNGDMYNAGQAGNTLSNGNGSQLSDGVPVYWKDGIVSALPMGAGNTWGLAGWVVIGP